MKVIVTGASGFIGREIVLELSTDEFELYQIGNTGLSSNSGEEKFYKADISKYEEVAKLKKIGPADALIHSAGLAHQFGNTAREQFRAVNIEGTKNILRLAVLLKVRHFVLIGSTAVYGTEKKTTDEVKVIDENAPCCPETFYAESKLEAEREAIAFCDENKINLTIFRLAPVIGEGNAGNVRRLIESLDKRRFIWIGNGENYKSLIYKRDVARACRMILLRKKSGTEIFNLAAAPILMRDFVGIAAQTLGKKIPGLSMPPKILEFFFKLNDKTLKISKIRKLRVTVEKWLSDDVYSTELFEREYGFKPEMTVLDALIKQIRNYRRFKEDGSGETK